MSDFGDSEDDPFGDSLDDLLNEGINRRVTERVKPPPPVQRTLTGERLEGPPAYEEITSEVSYGPSHHEMNREMLFSYVYPSNFEVRDYQYDIIAKALYRNILCAVPTGLGKTFIASTVMLNFYRWFPKGKIIFMAPTRPLVAQQISACLGVTDIASEDTAVLLDKTRRNRPEIWHRKRVFFTTPQVVENDLKAGTLNPKEIVCLVVDEAHRARKNYAYTNVVKFVERFNTSFRVLALTATPAADIEGVQEVVDNLSISHIELRTEESIDIIKYMKRKEQVKINVGNNADMDTIIELLSSAIDPVLKQANESNIYEVTDPSKINAFQVMTKSTAIVQNPTINEGLKWKYFYMLQVIGFVGQMLRRLKIYGVRSFYSYYKDKCAEFRTKYNMGKSTNKLAASFFFHSALKQIEAICEELIADSSYISHPKLEHLITELRDFCEDKKDSRVIVFTELRESALEIVKTLDHVLGDSCKAHIFIGQARGKEKFDEVEYKLRNSKKGRGKKNREERLEQELTAQEEKEEKKKQDAAKRAASRTSTSEEAQLQGMNQKTQKDIIKRFKKGEFQILVATSIGEEGLDIGEVDLIVCFDTTGSPIKNIQRMGRTGRKNDGKVILLFASNEENKFNQAMNDYAAVQKRIAHNDMNLHKSDRIVPPNITPVCEKRLIEIPESNLVISRGEDEDEIIKNATQAMLGNVPKKKTKRRNAKEALPPAMRKKRFFMPDNVETGFVRSSKLVRKAGGSDDLAPASEDDTGVSTPEPRGLSRRGNSSANSSTILGNLFSGSGSVNTPPAKKVYMPDVTASAQTSRLYNTTGPTDESIVIDLEEEDSEREVLGDLLSSPETSSKTSPILEVSKKSAREHKSTNWAQAFEDDFDDHSGISVDLEDNLTPVRIVLDTQDVVSDSEYGSDQENRLLQEAVGQVKGKTKQEVQFPDHIFTNENSCEPAMSTPLLNFDAYGDSDDELNPFEDAARVMEKQYENDLSFNYSEESELREGSKQLRRNMQVKPVQRNKALKDKVNKSTSPSPELRADIKDLLKEAKPKQKLGTGRMKADLTKVRHSQIIQIEDESQGLKRTPRVVYYSQEDHLVPNTFFHNEGFMTDDERKLFFAEVFHSGEVQPRVDPFLSAQRSIAVGVKHSAKSRRVATFHWLCQRRKRLNKMASEYALEDIKMEPVATLEHVPEFNRVDTGLEQEDGVKVEQMGSIRDDVVPLLSDDDDEFNNL